MPECDFLKPSVINLDVALPGVTSHFSGAQFEAQLDWLDSGTAEHPDAIEPGICVEHKPHFDGSAIVHTRQILRQRVLGTREGQEDDAAFAGAAVRSYRRLQPFSVPGIVDGILNRRHVWRLIRPIAEPILELEFAYAPGVVETHLGNVAFLSPLQSVNEASIRGPFRARFGFTSLAVIELQLGRVPIRQAAAPGERSDVQIGTYGDAR